MKRYSIYFSLAFIFANLSGCASMFIPVAGESFYKANIATIEVHTLEYVKSNLKYEMEIFEKLLIEILKNKGYHPFVGPRVFYNGGFLGTYAKNLISKSTADSVLIIDSYFEKMKGYSESENKKIYFEEILLMNVRHYFYDRNGDIILTTPDLLMGKVDRKANIPFSKLMGPNIRGFTNVIFYETEDEFIHRIAKELTENMPKRN